MGKRVLMRLRHDVENPKKHGSQTGIEYAPVWPAGTLFQVEDGREERFRELQEYGIPDHECPYWRNGDASDLSPLGKIYIQSGNCFVYVGSYHFDVDPWIIENHRKINLSVPRKMNAVFAALEPLKADVHMTKEEDRHG
ncbi:MAG: hypothetical protein EBS89_03470 [Proteobacteria bacterium]|nr:hypothetical protein [Pseudomonadota bacterium]